MSAQDVTIEFCVTAVTRFVSPKRVSAVTPCGWLHSRAWKLRPGQGTGSGNRRFELSEVGSAKRCKGTEGKCWILSSKMRSPVYRRLTSTTPTMKMT
eukprot:s2315_g19.t2